MAPLICWSFSSPMFRYRLVDHAVPAMWGRGEVQGGSAVGERPDHTRASPDFAQDTLERIVGANPPPVLLRKGVVAERLLDRRFHQLGGPGEAQATQLLDHLDSLLARCRDVLARMDRLEHGRNLPHLGRGHVTEDITAPLHAHPLPNPPPT